MDNTSEDPIKLELESVKKKFHKEKRFVIPVAILIFISVFLLVFQNFFSRILSTIFSNAPAAKQINAFPTQLPPSVVPTANVQAHIMNRVDSRFSLSQGYSMGYFAKDLSGGVRDLTFSDGGVLLASIPSDGKVIALPDRDFDGSADSVETVITGANKPHGLAFFNNKLFVASENSVARYLWDEQKLSATFERKLFDLPSGAGHNTRSIVFDSKGRMFVSIGSSCNVCREGDDFRSAVIVSDENGLTPLLFSKGLRNAVFMSLKPNTDEIWTTEMGRDNLGDNLPPDEINILADGGDFGWPICYGQNIHDSQFDRNTYIQNPCNGKIPPIFEVPAHSAPLGLTFINSAQFPKDWQGDLLVSYHGSWNRSVPDGYKVVRLHVEGNKIRSSEDFITGFIQGRQVIARPVDLIFDQQGSLYLSDDKANAIYKIIKKN